jgi:hypothetical protein
MLLRWVVGSFLVLCCVMALSTAVRADDVSGSVNGFVYGGDILGDHSFPIRHATVSVYSWDHSAPVARRFTDDNGFFTFLGLPPGRYYMSAGANGYSFYCPRRVVAIPGGFYRTNLGIIAVEKDVRILDVLCARQEWADEGVYF